MSKRSTRPSDVPTRTRSAATVGKPFPWSSVLGATALGLVLLAVLGYAVVNAGSEAPSPLADADAAIPGLDVAAEPLSQEHQDGALAYDRTPSRGGAHNLAWTTCTGNVYTDQVSDEHATHSMEHGAVWVTYRPDLPVADVTALRELVDGQDYRLLSPYPGLDSAVSIQAWGRQLAVDSAQDPRLEEFATAFTNGPQTPEKGATCSSGTTSTGADPVEK